jgi:diguanylate cyclase (GGDEF)-like protein
MRDSHLARRMLDLAEPVRASAISDPTLTSVLSLAGVDQGVVVSITARNELFGVLVVSTSGQGLDSSTRERLVGAASLAATALDSVVLLDEVRYQALHDPITDLANSRLFEDRVTTALSVARRSGNKLAVLFVDLDRFKIVNDRHGHTVGDELLRAVAERVQVTVREGDTIARLGGDEFGILLQDVQHAEDAIAVASKVVSVISAPFAIRGYTLSVGASVGVALFPERLDSYESVICRADGAMYQAKADGRGRVHLAGSPSRTVEG